MPLSMIQSRQEWALVVFLSGWVGRITTRMYLWTCALRSVCTESELTHGDDEHQEVFRAPTCVAWPAYLLSHFRIQ